MAGDDYKESNLGTHLIEPNIPNIRTPDQLLA